MSVRSTRLRVAISRDLETLLSWVNDQPFKVEIKGQPLNIKNKWHLFFVLPENDNPIIASMPLTVDLD